MEKLAMQSSHRAARPALRLAGLGAGLALLLGACDQAPPEGEQQQQGSLSPPAATDQLAAPAVRSTT
jgi:hypothetical protein